MFAASTWESIVANKDLDLPTQQQLLAQFRCDEIAKVAFDEFAIMIKSIKPILDKGSVCDEFGTICSDALQSTIGILIAVKNRLL